MTTLKIQQLEEKLWQGICQVCNNKKVYGLAKKQVEINLSRHEISCFEKDGVTKPIGRPPKGHIWDNNLGKYVRDLGYGKKDN